MKRRGSGWKLFDLREACLESTGPLTIRLVPCESTPAVQDTKCAWIRDVEVVSCENTDARPVAQSGEDRGADEVQTGDLNKSGDNINGPGIGDAPLQRGPQGRIRMSGGQNVLAHGGTESVELGGVSR